MTAGCGSRQVGIIDSVVQGGWKESNYWKLRDPRIFKKPRTTCLVSCGEFHTTCTAGPSCINDLWLLMNILLFAIVSWSEHGDLTCLIRYAILWHLDCLPFCLDAVVSFPLGGPTVITLLAVHLHGSSLADDKQAADGSEGGGDAAECQHTRTVVLQLLQPHRAAPAQKTAGFSFEKHSRCSVVMFFRSNDLFVSSVSNWLRSSSQPSSSLT